MFRFMTAFLHDLDLFKHISRYLGLQTSDFHFIYIIRFVFSLLSKAVIQTVLLQKLAKLRRKENEKAKIMAWAFLQDLDSVKHISRYLGLQTTNFYFIFIIRFVFLLAFQSLILNCSTAKTCKDPAKRMRKAGGVRNPALQ